jgi:monothiol glutaredoxin
MSTRPSLAADRIAPAALETMARFEADTLTRVRDAIRASDVVVVGMAQNPHVRRARRALEGAGIVFEYLEYGSYLSGWRRRLAIKLWSGWPTFPQVFVRGHLLGGADAVEAAIADGSLRERLQHREPAAS